jgi:hypothetical protein
MTWRHDPSAAKAPSAAVRTALLRSSCGDSRGESAVAEEVSSSLSDPGALSEAAKGNDDGDEAPEATDNHWRPNAPDAPDAPDAPNAPDVKLGVTSSLASRSTVSTASTVSHARIAPAIV